MTRPGPKQIVEIQKWLKVASQIAADLGCEFRVWGLGFRVYRVLGLGFSV